MAKVSLAGSRFRSQAKR